MTESFEDKLLPVVRQYHYAQTTVEESYDGEVVRFYLGQLNGIELALGEAGLWDVFQKIHRERYGE